MENSLPLNRTTGKGRNASGPAAVPAAPETQMEHDTVTPDESDPLWEELGATRIVGGPSNSSYSGVNLDSPASYTELSPSRVLGKNLLSLGDFQLLKKLGEGAMGAVYKALQVSFERTVALKVLFPHVASNPKLVQRLYREGTVMGQLDHPNIVQAYAIGEAEGCYYIAMEYVAGQSMQKWLTQLGRLPVADSVRIALDCARALAYAHSLNMVHRDIKPDNILLTKTGIVKVADLGMVKTHDDDMSLTQTGHAVGTPWFMPLEQARNAKEIDGRSDIYALGCTLYAFLTGHPPFIGRTIVDVIQAKEVGTFPPARQMNPNVTERLDLVLAKMTAKMPKYRYQTCDELVKDLESLGLASETLSFIQYRPVLLNHSQATPLPGKTSVIPVLGNTKGDADATDLAQPPIDPDLWFVQTKTADGVVTRKYTTTQLQKLLSDGVIKPSARASHSPVEGFRTLGTYKEFQGAAMNKMSKKAADNRPARDRGIIQNIEEAERQHKEKERVGKVKETTSQATTRYWLSILYKVVPIAVGVLAVLGFIIWLMSRI